MIFFRFIVFCFLPIYLFSQSSMDRSSSYSNVEKLDFECPYHCGFWGSESIRGLEWDFIQCLYSGHAMTHYIAENYHKRKKNLYRGSYKNFVPEEVAFEYSQPQNFSSSWYQYALETNAWFISFSENIPDEWGCNDGTCSVWQIRHAIDDNGDHIGKYFIRSLYVESYDENDSIIIDDDKFEEDSEPYWEFQNSTIYQLGNYVDFNNACGALEVDILRERNADPCRDYVISPIFKGKIIEKYAQVNQSIQELKKSHHNIFEKCATSHRAPSAFYNLALYDLANGEYWNGLEHLRSLLDRVKLESLERNFASEIHLSKGATEVEVALYDEAILSLTKAIELNPKNHEAYFERSIAYFEKGEFDLSLQDYLETINQKKTFLEYLHLYEFGLGITLGGAKGINEASVEFLPSICSSICGVGNLLWTTINQPVESAKQFAAATIELCKYLQKCDPTELAKILVPEMYELVTNWDNLNYKQRGELAGYVLGKYGMDILLSVAVMKGAAYVKAYQEMRRAEKLCTLEMLAQSSKSKKALTKASIRWQAQREAYFAKVQLEIDKQTKHIPGSWNYEKERNRSVFTHSDPQKLLRQKAGKGQKIQGIVGKPGYRERVDFGEVIGEFANGTMTVPTTVGIIHYSKKGAHIVPAKPK